jgi:hypothetical protein
MRIAGGTKPRHNKKLVAYVASVKFLGLRQCLFTLVFPHRAQTSTATHYGVIRHSIFSAQPVKVYSTVLSDKKYRVKSSIGSSKQRRVAPITTTLLTDLSVGPSRALAQTLRANVPRPHFLCELYPDKQTPNTCPHRTRTAIRSSVSKLRSKVSRACRSSTIYTNIQYYMRGDYYQ